MIINSKHELDKLEVIECIDTDLTLYCNIRNKKIVLINSELNIASRISVINCEFIIGDMKLKNFRNIIQFENCTINGVPSLSLSKQIKLFANIKRLMNKYKYKLETHVLHVNNYNKDLATYVRQMSQEKQLQHVDKYLVFYLLCPDFRDRIFQCTEYLIIFLNEMLTLQNKKNKINEQVEILYKTQKK